MSLPPAARHVSDCHGQTPVVRLARLAPRGNLFAKLELRSVGQSWLDRAAAALLGPGAPLPEGPVREGGDGALACALAPACLARGLRLEAWVPESSSHELLQTLELHRATVHPVPHAEGAAGAEAAARRHGPLLRDLRPFALDAAARALAEELGAQVEASRAGCEVLVVGAVEPLVAALGAFVQGRRARLLVVAPGADGAAPHRQVGHSAAIAALPAGAELRRVKDAEAWQAREAFARSEGLLLGPAAAAVAKVALDEALACPDARVWAVLGEGGERAFSLGATFR